jgi:hypothetical protein
MSCNMPFNYTMKWWLGGYLNKKDPEEEASEQSNPMPPIQQPFLEEASKQSNPMPTIQQPCCCYIW